MDIVASGWWVKDGWGKALVVGLLVVAMKGVQALVEVLGLVRCVKDLANI